MKNEVVPPSRRILDPTKRSEATDLFNEVLGKNVIGQPKAVTALTEMFQKYTANMCAPGRPIQNFLFLGPTGTGKTHIFEAASKALFGNKNTGLILVDCAEFQHSHEIAKLIGSPPGYLGHRETHPVLTQESLAAGHTDHFKMSFVLFDEIEKASDALWNLLLGIMDKATLTLGDNKRVDFSNVVIGMTSNIGAKEIEDLTVGGFGFNPAVRGNDAMEAVSLQKVRKRFTPEFMNRLDKIVVFNSLKDPELYQILTLELDKVYIRLINAMDETNNGRPLTKLILTDAAEALLLKEGTSRAYGARHLKRAIENLLVNPLTNLLSSGQIQHGSSLVVDSDGNKLNFYVEEETLA